MAAVKKKEGKLYGQKGKGNAMCASVAIAVFPLTHRLGFFQIGLVHLLTEWKSGWLGGQKEKQQAAVDM